MLANLAQNRAAMPSGAMRVQDQLPPALRDIRTFQEQVRADPSRWNEIEPEVRMRLEDPNLPVNLAALRRDTMRHTSRLHLYEQRFGVDLLDPGIHDGDKYTNLKFATLIAHNQKLTDAEKILKEGFHSEIFAHHAEWEKKQAISVGAYDITDAMHFARQYKDEISWARLKDMFNAGVNSKTEKQKAALFIALSNIQTVEGDFMKEHRDLSRYIDPKLREQIKSLKWHYPWEGEQ